METTQQTQPARTPTRSNEPIFWFLFGAGGMVGAILLPVLIVITGLWQPESVMNYETMLAFSQSILGKLVILAAIIFPLWNGMHRILHGLHDIGVHIGHSLEQKLFYGFAALISVITLVLVLAVGW